MAYIKTNWKDYPDTTTPITADRLNHMEDGISEAAKNGGGESDKIGVIKMFGGSTAPDGWLICDGSLISRTEYSGLFNVIGTSYNLETDTDDTKFRLPNLKGRVPVGLDSEDTDFNTLGKTGGEKNHQHSIPLFMQASTGAGGDMVVNWNGVQYGLGSAETIKTQAWGKIYTEGNVGNKTGYPLKSSINNYLQPYIVTNYIIKASETTPIQAEVVDSLDGNSTTNAPSVRAVNDGLLDKYSTDEQVIGTWFGKKLYRKTFYRSKLINGIEETVNHGIANVDKIWPDVSNSFAIWPAGFTGNIPYLNSNFENSIFLTDIGATTFKLTSGLDRSDLSGYITLLYTKTTD